jgi:RNA polymerase sigma-70 factor, ECF subfamily
MSMLYPPVGDLEVGALSSPSERRSSCASPQSWIIQVWAPWLASVVGLGFEAGNDTPHAVWETACSGVDMSSRPIAVESPKRAEEFPSSELGDRAAALGDAFASSGVAPGAAPGALIEPQLEVGTKLSDALRAGEPYAVGRLFDLYGKHVERVLVRTIGRDGEMDDMVQDVFLGAYRSGPNYQGNDGQLKAWVSRIAVFTARGYLRKRKRRWWLRPSDPQEIPEQTSNEPSPHTQEVLRRTYVALDTMDPDLRIPLALRELEAMELSEIAEACDCSVSTVKRRLARARKAFERLAKKDPILRDWLEDEN